MLAIIPGPGRVDASSRQEDHQISHAVGSDLLEGRAKLMHKLMLWGNGFAADHRLRAFHNLVEPLHLQAALPVWPVRFRSRYSQCKDGSPDVQEITSGSVIQISPSPMSGKSAKAPSFIGAGYFGHGCSYVRALKIPN